MAFFEDLTVYRYGRPEAGGLNVGWLGEGEPFQTGETSDAFQAALNELCNNNSINHCWGHHVCEFCSGASFGDPYFHDMGNGEIRVRGAGGIWYVAPRLVFHYVVEHNYCPPQVFVDAVLSPMEIGKEEPIQHSEEEMDRRMRDFDKQRRELAGPPITEVEIDEIVRKGIKRTNPKKAWLRFW